MSHLNENELRVFVDAIKHLFGQMTQYPAEIRSAYLGNSEISQTLLGEGADDTIGQSDDNYLPMPVNDYTGLIKVSGDYTGSVYFTAPRHMMLAFLLESGETETTDSNLLDAVGEIANTISGNVRQHFGETLEISPPVLCRGDRHLSSMGVRDRPFIINLAWQQYEASVVVDIDEVH
ncbi:chemotaxis protein CheX [Ampullimonas aquatilis]|uniref:chemotaxis protein CheX n=1 Tax=Ampullimonas aquatilis TaxID=1341549 RepID=UPI003C70948F